MYNVIEYNSTYREKTIKLIENIFVEEFGFLEFRDSVLNKNFDFSNNIDEKCWIILDNFDEVIGTISCLKKDINECYLKYFYLNKEYRGLGLGSKLFEVFMNFVKKHNYKKIYLGTYERLERAVSFYKKKGFVEYENEFAKQGEKFFVKDCSI